jgi:hypothetical protein
MHIISKLIYCREEINRQSVICFSPNLLDVSVLNLHRPNTIYDNSGCVTFIYCSAYLAKAETFIALGRCPYEDFAAAALRMSVAECSGKVCI